MTQDLANPQRVTLGDVATELMHRAAGDAKPTRDHLEKAIVELKRQRDEALASKSLVESQLEGALRDRDLAQNEVAQLRQLQSVSPPQAETTGMSYPETLKWVLTSQIDIVDMLHVIGTYISEGSEEQLLELAMLTKARIQEAAERNQIDKKEVMPEERLHDLIPLRREELEVAKDRGSEERER